MIDELFLFPIVSLDGDKEDIRRKESEMKSDLGIEDEYEPEMYFAEAEYPYFDFVGVQDHWLPTKRSQEKALDGDFDACVVRFLNVGQLLVPWSRGKFKSEIKKFADDYAAKHPKEGDAEKELMVVNLTDDQLEKLMKDAKQD